MNEEEFDALPLEDMLAILVQNIMADGIRDETARQLVTYLQCAGHMELMMDIEMTRRNKTN